MLGSLNSFPTKLTTGHKDHSQNADLLVKQSNRIPRHGASRPDPAGEFHVMLHTPSKRVPAAIHTQHHLTAEQAYRHLQLHDMATTSKSSNLPGAPNQQVRAIDLPPFPAPAPKNQKPYPTAGSLHLLKPRILSTPNQAKVTSTWLNS
ncbi:hypothetical protein Nepgr_003923 [Nepenthes gracilis]|uniref:Uncharacterized protein n=1 Tax=Nepenthes gracilis TaxID=150966 RepID=A0AAD3XEC9_NEPGR|nr:hypothetical protein Nepgr_003923 [Nepenthes gracilis]